MLLCLCWYKLPFTNLSIKHFRCFEDLQIELSPGVNLFYGANGSGKTSLLESVYIFSSGKSFKSTNLKSLINYKHNKCENHTCCVKNKK